MPLFVLLTLCACSAKIDQAKFEAVYRAGKSMEGATSTGVTWLKYSELMQAFATEVSIAKDKAQSTIEQELVSLYGEALIAYQDAQIVWRKKIGHDGNLGISESEMKRIVEAYPIQGAGSGSSFSFSPDQAIQTIWVRAGAKLRDANEKYTGKESNALPVAQ